MSQRGQKRKSEALSDSEALINLIKVHRPDLDCTDAATLSRAQVDGALVHAREYLEAKATANTGDLQSVAFAGACLTQLYIEERASLQAALEELEKAKARAQKSEDDWFEEALEAMLERKNSFELGQKLAAEQKAKAAAEAEVEAAQRRAARFEEDAKEAQKSLKTQMDAFIRTQAILLKEKRKAEQERDDALNELETEEEMHEETKEELDTMSAYAEDLEAKIQSLRRPARAAPVFHTVATDSRLVVIRASPEDRKEYQQPFHLAWLDKPFSALKAGAKLTGVWCIYDRAARIYHIDPEASINKEGLTTEYVLGTLSSLPETDEERRQVWVAVRTQCDPAFTSIPPP